MATKELLIKIKADGKNAEAVFKRIEAEAGKMGAKVERAGKRGQKGLTALDKSAIAARLSMRRLARAVTAVASAVAAGGLARSVFEVSAKFQGLKTQLEVAVGSAERANDVFNALSAVSTGLPVSVEEIVSAFVRMRNLGLQPTTAALTSFTNTAAAMNKNLMDFVEAVADAATGEFERLKEFGIKAKNQGDTVAFTFKGTTTVVKNSAEEITAYLQKLGETDFAGAGTKQMQTLIGLTSNMRVEWENLMASIGRAGANGVFGSTLMTMERIFTDLSRAISAANSKAEEMPRAFGWLVDAAHTIAGNVHDMALAFEALATRAGLVFAILNVVGRGMFDEITAIWDAYKTQMADIERRSKAFWEALTKPPAEKKAQAAAVIDAAARAPLTVTISGGQQAQQQQKITAAMRRSLNAQKKIREQMQKNEEQMLAAEQGTLQQSLQDWADYYRTLAKYDTDWQRVIQRGINEYKDSIGTMAERIQNATANAFKSMEDAVLKFVTTGKASFSDFANSVINDLLRIMIQRSITTPLANAIGSINWGSLFTANATGGVYSGAGISQYSNQIVDAPTIFPFAKGIGLMGEAGPEAIMPLTRTPSGHLGVRAEGGGGVVVNIIEDSSRAGQVNQRQEGGQNVIDVFVEQVKNAIAGDIATGRGRVPQALQRTYGLNRVAGAY